MAINPFQQGQQFVSQQKQRAVELEAAQRREEGINALADMFGPGAQAPAEFAAVTGAAGREEQRDIQNVRQAQIDQQAQEKLDLENEFNASKNIINFWKSGLANNVPAEELIERTLPALASFGVTEDQVGPFTEQFIANPQEFVNQMDAVINAAGRRLNRKPSGAPIRITTPEGFRVVQAFDDGSFEELTDPTTGEPLVPADVALRERGLEQREAGFRGDVAEAEAKGKALGKAKGEIIAGDLPPGRRETAAGKRALNQAQLKTDFVLDTIDTALGQTNAWTTGFLSLGRFIGGTPQADLAANLDTIKANVGFDELQRMRDNSKTGGALGQISELENRLLQAVWGAVTQSQSPSQLKRNLEILKTTIVASRQRVARAFEEDFGVVYGGEGTIIPGVGAPIDPEIEALLDQFAPEGQ